MSFKSWLDWSESLVPASIPKREYYKIGEVSDSLQIKPYVLRYWETEFSILSPEKSHGNQRIYRRRDLAAAFLIKFLLYNEKFSIEGARRKIKNYKQEETEAVVIDDKLSDESLHGNKVSDTNLVVPSYASTTELAPPILREENKLTFQDHRRLDALKIVDELFQSLQNLP